MDISIRNYMFFGFALNISLLILSLTLVLHSVQTSIIASYFGSAIILGLQRYIINKSFFDFIKVMSAFLVYFIGQSLIFLLISDLIFNDFLDITLLLSTYLLLTTLILTFFFILK